MAKKEEYIYGIRPAIEAIKAGKEIEKVFLQKGLRGELFHEFLNLLREFEIPFQFVPVEKLNRLSRQNHQGVITYLSEITYTKLEDLVPFIYEQGRTPLLLILDGITDVRNIGAIARSAECAGADGMVIPARGSARINSDAIKTSAGALYKLPVVRSENLKESVRFLKESGLSIFAATEKASLTFHQPDYKRPLALILGSEGEGINPDILTLCDETVKIPVYGEIESLNVSVASGVLLYEIIRQRQINS